MVYYPDIGMDVETVYLANQRLAPIKQQLTESDAFIIISPEWHGQVPAGLKNFFLMFNRFELGHKPALIVTVSSADGGAYPVAELRMSSYKNNRLCYIPEQLVLRNIEKILNEKADENTDESADEYFKERISWMEKNGIDRERIIVDPGIGFGKTLEHNLEILRNVQAFKKLDCPVLIGHSRKSFFDKLPKTAFALVNIDDKNGYVFLGCWNECIYGSYGNARNA